MVLYSHSDNREQTSNNKKEVNKKIMKKKYLLLGFIGILFILTVNIQKNIEHPTPENNIKISEAIFELVDFEFIEEWGDGDNNIDADELWYLKFRIKNIGNTTASTTQVSIWSNSPYIRFNGYPRHTISQLMPNYTATHGQYNIDGFWVRDTTPEYTKVYFDIWLWTSSSDDHIVDFQVSMTVIEAVPEKPSGSGNGDLIAFLQLLACYLLSLILPAIVIGYIFIQSYFKNLLDKIILEIFGKIKDISKKTVGKKITSEIKNLLTTSKKSKVKRIKKNREKIYLRVSELKTEYDNKILEQKRTELIGYFEKYRFAIRKSLVQWNIGLYRDQTRENILGWILHMETFIWSLIYHIFDKKEQKKIKDKDTTFVAPLLANIVTELDEFKNLIKRKDIGTFNKLLSTTKGIYEATEILIGEKPLEKVVREVREVVLTVREKPKPQPKSTKFICFNCDKEYDKPIDICEKCGFVFKKNKRK